MADSFTVDLDAASVIEALTTLGDAAQPYVLEASRISAESIDREATGRVARATGETARGIEVRPDRSGLGYLVVAANDRMPNLPLWIERGTRKGKPRSHSEPARPFFDISAQLEAGAHLRRIEEALERAIDQKGLGR